MDVPANLVSATETWNTLQIWERLLGLKGKNLSATPSRFAADIGIHDLEHVQSNLETTVSNVTSALFKETNVVPDFDSKPILWENP